MVSRARTKAHRSSYFGQLSRELASFRSFIASLASVALVVGLSAVVTSTAAVVADVATAAQAQAAAPEFPSEKWITTTHGNTLTCGKRADGWYCWGTNDKGQLGNGSTTNTGVPTKIVEPAGITIDKVNAGFRQACGIGSDGQVWCWGYQGTEGAMGPNVPLVASGVGATTPVRATGWNSDSSGRTFTQVSVGSDFVCALDNQAQVQCWGMGPNGELGRGAASGTTTSDTSPSLFAKPVTLPTGVTGWRRVAAGQWVACAEGMNGATYVGVFCWGANRDGRTVQSTATGTLLKPTPVGMPPVAGGAQGQDTIFDVLVSEGSNCVDRFDGVYCAGYNDHGQIGHAPVGTTTRGEYLKVTLGGAQMSGAAYTKNPALGWFGNCYEVFKADDTPFGTGVACSGHINQQGRGSGSNVSEPFGPVIMSAFPGITLSNPAGGGYASSVCADGSDNHTYCWGQNSGGSLGNGATSGNNGNLPIQLIEPAYADLRPAATQTPGSATFDLTFSKPVTGITGFDIGISGTAQVGETTVSGSGASYTVTVPVELTGTVIAKVGSNQVADSFGNSPSQTATVEATQKATPAGQWVPGTVTTGEGGACAQRADGDWYCWGDNSKGQLGNGSFTKDWLPHKINTSTLPDGVTLTRVVMSGYATCAIGSDGALYCWGWADQQILGPDVPYQQSRALPVRMTLPGGAKAVSVSVSTTPTNSNGSNVCAEGDNQKIYCWGDNGGGAVGNNTTSDYVAGPTASPTLPTGVGRFGQPSAGEGAVCANGYNHSGALIGVYCWGWGANGRTGNGGTANQTTPGLVNSGVAGVRLKDATLRAGGCAQGENNWAYCWGYGLYGGNGDGTDNDKSAPIPVQATNLIVGPGLEFHRAHRTSGANGCAEVRNSGGAIGSGVVCWGGWIVGVQHSPGRDRWRAEQPVQLPAGTPTGTTLSSVSRSTATGTICGSGSNGGLYCWGKNDFGQLGNGTIDTPQYQASTLVAQPYYVDFQAAATQTDGSATYTAVFSTTPGGAGVEVTGFGPQDLDLTGTAQTRDPEITYADGTYTIVVPVDRTGTVKAKLSPNVLAFPGNVASETVTIDVDTTTLATSPENWVPGSVVGGNGHVCALRGDGYAYCWGGNAFGQLGNGTVLNSDLPRKVATKSLPSGVTLISVVAAGKNTCGAGSDGSVYCWGVNATGQLGPNSTVGTSSAKPLQTSVEGVRFVRVAITADGNNAAVCAEGDDEQVYCWGYNSQGQLGRGVVNSPASDRTPAAVSLPAGIGRIARPVSGLRAFCAEAYALDGTYAGSYCWGMDNWSKLGNGGSEVNAPVPGPVTSATGVTLRPRTADGAACHVGDDAKVYCAGGPASDGRIGVGAPSIQQTADNPVILAGAVNSGTNPYVTAPSAMTAATCAEARNSAGPIGAGITCFGSAGYLGNGATTQSNRAETLVALPVGVSTTLSRLSLGGGDMTTMCASGADGNLYCWGDDALGARGNGPTVTANSAAATLVAEPLYPIITAADAQSPGAATFTVKFSTTPDGANPATVTGFTASDLNVGGSALDRDPVLTGSGSTYTVTVPVDRVGTVRLSVGPNVVELPGNVSAGLTIDASEQTAAVQDWVPGSTVGGVDHECAKRGDGSWYCWGRNDVGQLGNGLKATATMPVRVNTSTLPSGVTLRKLTAGGYNTCAIGSDDAVYCWGTNQYGQLGMPANNPAYSPFPVRITLPGGVAARNVAIASIWSSQRGTVCAEGSDDLIYCWGSNGSFMLGQPGLTNTGASPETPSTPVALPAGVDRLARPSGGQENFCAEGYASDDDYLGLYCWGSDLIGSLGDGGGDGGAKALPVRVAAPAGVTLRRISTDGGKCASGSDGNLYCWGAASGRNGDGSNTVPISAPSKVSLTGSVNTGVNPRLRYSSVTGYGGCAEAFNDAGAIGSGVSCWGDASSRGDGSTTNPVTTAATTVTLPAGTAPGTTLSRLGRGGPQTNNCASGSDGNLYCWGTNDSGTIGNGTINATTPQRTAALVAEPYFVDVQPAATQTQGSAKFTIKFSLTPGGAAVTPAGFTISDLSTFGTAGMGNGTLTPDAATKVYTVTIPVWASGSVRLKVGDNVVDYPGNVAASASLTATVPAPSTAGFKRGTTTVGLSHVCAQRYDDNWYCWGRNNDGQLGNGTTTNSHTPIAVSLPAGVTFTKVVAGGNNTCAVGDDGNVWCWGNNESRQLKAGADNTVASSLPVKTTLPAAARRVSVSTGWLSFDQTQIGRGTVCAEAVNDKVYCWGFNSFGNTGRGTAAAPYTTNPDPNADLVPVTLPAGVAKLTRIDGGGLITCAEGYDSSNTLLGVYCWGAGGNGILGVGSTTNYSYPVKANQPPGVVFAKPAAESGVCVTGSDELTYCWGYGAHGRLGNKSTGDQSSPVRVITDDTGSLLAGLGTRLHNPAGALHNFCAEATHAGAIGTGVSCWGKADGLAQENTTNQTTAATLVKAPADVTLRNVSSGATGSTICADGSDGHLYCWGWDDFGNRGNGATVTATEAAATAVFEPLYVKITPAATQSAGSATYSVTFSTTPDHLNPVTVTGFDANDVSVDGLALYREPVVTAPTGEGTTYTIKVPVDSAGTVKVRVAPNGVTEGNTLSNLSTVTATIATPPTGSWVRATATAGSKHVCAQREDGYWYCWGDNTRGQLGIGTTTGSTALPTRVKVPAGVTFSKLTIGGRNTCAVGSDGDVYCWGENAKGQLGPDQPMGVNAQNVPLSTGTPVAITLPGTVKAREVAVSSDIDDINYGTVCAEGDNDKIYCWGGNKTGELGRGGAINVPTHDQSPGLISTATLPTGVARLSHPVAGPALFCATGYTSDNLWAGLYCWGHGGDGRLGAGAGVYANQTAPGKVALPTGTNFGRPSLEWGGCVRGFDSTLWCWGANYKGEVGNNSLTKTALPTQITPAHTGTTPLFGKPGVGATAACVEADAAGAAAGSGIACWGDVNLLGGSPAAIKPANTIPVPATGVTLRNPSQGTDDRTICADGSDKHLYCWGYDDHGQRADGATTTTASSIASQAAEPWYVEIKPSKTPTNGNAVFTITFTGGSPNTLTGFDLGDITIGGTAATQGAATLTGTGTTRTLTVPINSPTTDGTVTAYIGTNKVEHPGNVESTIATVVIDKTPPTTPVISAPTAGSVRSTSLTTITGTAETPHPITVTIDGAAAACSNAPVKPDANGDWSCTLATPLTDDGAYLIKVTSTDLAGNTADSATAQVTIDKTPPAAPAISSPANASTVNKIQTVTGHAEAGATIKVFVDGTSVACTGGDPVAVDAFTPWSCPLATPVTVDGTYSITAKQIDVGGNTGPLSAANVVSIDTTPPAAPTVTNPLSGPQYVPLSVITGRGEPGATVTIALADNATQDPATPLACTPAAVVNSAGTWNCTVDPAIGNGSYTLTATQTDLAGNTATANTEVIFEVDTNALPQPVVDQPAADSFGQTPITEITGTSPMAATITVFLDLAAPYQAGTSTPYACASGSDLTVETDGGSWSCLLSTPITTGTHEVFAVADADPKQSAPSIPHFFTVDAVPPTAPVISSPSNGLLTQGPITNVTGTGEPLATLELFVDGVSTGCVPATVTVNNSGVWTCTLVTPISASGDYVFTAALTDAAGNTSAQTDPGNTVTVDRTAPDAPTIDRIPADAATANQPVQQVTTITGTGETGSTVAVAIDGDPVTCSNAPVKVVDGVWSCQIAAFTTEGLHTVTASQTDGPGNVSAEGSGTFLIDRTAPHQPTITGPADGTSRRLPVSVVSGSGEVGAVVTLTASVDGGAADPLACTAPPVVVDASGSWSCALQTPLSAEGTYSLVAKQRDSAGNLSVGSEPASITIDTTAPNPPVISAPAEGTTTKESVTTVSGTGEVGATVAVTIDGDPVTCSDPVTVAADGTWSCLLQNPLAAAGEHLIRATQADAQGNTSGAGLVHVTIDTTPPAAPAITTPADGTLWNTSVSAISGAGERGATVEVTVAGLLGGEASCTTTVVDGGGLWHCDLDSALAADDNYTVTATQTDAAGNTSTEASSTFEIDKTGPADPIITNPGDGSATNQPVSQITGTADDPDAKTVVVSGLPSGRECTGVVTVAADRTWTCTLLQPIKADGTYTATAVAKDQAGNSSPQVTSTFAVDTTAPAAPKIGAPSDGLLTSAPVTAIAGTAEPGALITLTGATCTETVHVDTSGYWTCQLLEPITTDEHTVGATQTDSAGNASPKSTSTFTVDTEAPPAPVITTPAAGPVSSVTTVSGSGDNGARVTVTGLPSGITCDNAPVVVANGAWSCTLSATLPDGPYSLTASQADKAGNHSPTSDPVAFTVDTVAPGEPIISAPEAGLRSTSVTTISGTGEPNSTIAVTLTGTQSDAPACQGIVTVDFLGQWSCTLNPELSADGKHTIAVTQTDLAGNVSPAASLTVTIDTTAPEPPAITEPANGALVNTDVSVISGTGEPGATVALSGLAGQSCVTAVLVGADSTWACTLAAPLPQGIHTMSATQTDPGGNTSVASALVAFTIDSVAPATATILTPTDGSTQGALDKVTGTGEANASVTVTITDANDAVVSTCTTTVSGTDYSCTLDPEVATSGTYTVSVKLTDAANNTSGAATATVTVDVTAPGAPTIADPVNGALLNTDVTAISGTGEPGATVTLTGLGERSCTAEVIVGEGGGWVCTLDAALGEGAHSVRAKQTDAYGNVSLASAATSLTIDLTAPAAPTIVEPANGSVLTTDVTTISGTGEAGATVTLLGHTCVETVVVNAEGFWTCVLQAPLPHGAHSLTATQTDPAGNGSDPSDMSIFTIDTMAPDGPVVVFPSEGAVLDDLSTVTGTGELGATVVVTVAGTDSTCTTAVDGSGDWTCDLAPVIQHGGTYTIGATQTDEAGNQSATTFVEVKVDGTPPPVPVITAPVDGSHRNTDVTVVTGTGEAGASIRITVDGGTAFACPDPVAADDTWSCTLPTAISAAGEHTITVGTADPFGNAQPTPAVTTFTIDKSTPTAPVITGPGDGSTVGEVTALTGIGEAGATITLTLDDEAAFTCPNPVDEFGAWSCMLPTPVTVDGPHTAAATQTDAAGNVSPAANTSFTLDSTNPDAPVFTDPADGSFRNTVVGRLAGTGEEGARITLTVEGAPVTCTNGPIRVVNGLWSCTLSSIISAAGLHTAVAVATDAGGNKSAPGTSAFTLDFRLPSAPVVTSPARSSFVGAPVTEVKGTGEPFATVTLKVDGTSTTCANAPVTVAADGVWSCVLPTAITGDGTHSTLTVQTDRAGNASSATTTQFVIDTSAPAAPGITGPVSASSTNQPVTTVTGTGEYGNLINVTIDGFPAPCSNAPVKVLAGGGWTCALAVPLTADATYLAGATQIDRAGNPSAQALVAFSVDTTAPSAPVIGSPAPSSWQPEAVTQITGTGEPGAKVTFAVDAVPVTCANAPVTVAVDGSFTCRLPADRQITVDGTHLVVAQQTDNAGNESAKASSTFLVDVTAPAAPTIGAPAHGMLTNQAVTTVRGTGEPNNRIKLAVDGDPVTCTTSPVAPGVDGFWSCTLTTPVTAEGTHTVSATQSDLVGHASPSTSVTFTIDTTAPKAPLITAPADGSETNWPITMLRGTGEPGSRVSSVVINGTTAACGNNTVVSVTGTWECLLIQPRTAEGAYSFTVALTDPAGNTSSDTASLAIIDTTAPVAPVILEPANGTVVNASGYRVVSGAGVPGSTLKLAVDGQPATCTEGTVKVAADRTWSCTLTTPITAHGIHEILATQTDRAGNTGVADSATVAVDTEEPAAPAITSPTQGLVTAAALNTVHGTGEPGAEITRVLVNGRLVGCANKRVIVDEHGAWGCVLVDSFDADGHYAINATQSDQVGNESVASAVVTMQVDSTMPDAPVLTSPEPGARVNVSVSSLEGTGEPHATLTSLTVGGKPVACGNAPVTVDGTGVWSCDLVNPLTAEETYVIVVKIADQAGNTATSGPAEVTVDKTAPKAPVIAGAGAGGTNVAVNHAVEALTGTAEPFAEITTITVGGVAAECESTPVADATGAWWCALTTPLGEGSHAVTAVATDLAGNHSPAGSNTLLVDLTAPARPVFTQPAPGSVTDQPITTLTGTGEPGARVVLTRDGAPLGCSNAPIVTAADGTWSCQLATPLTQQGSYNLGALATDPAGNDSAPGGAAVGIDLTPPAPAGDLSLPPSGTGATTPTESLSGTAEPGSTITVMVDGKPVACTNAPVIAAADGTWTCALATPITTNGSHTVAVTVTDRAGNTTTSSTTFAVDLPVPGAPEVTSVVDGGLYNKALASLTGRGAPGGTITAILVDRAAVACTNAPVRVAADGTWTCALATPITGEGVHTVSAEQLDVNGNRTPASTDSFELDFTAPKPPVITKPANESEWLNGFTVIAGNGEPRATLVSLTVDGAAQVCTNAPVVVGLDGTWTCNLATPIRARQLASDPASSRSRTAIGTGRHVIHAVLRDRAGNDSQATQSQFTLIDLSKMRPFRITNPKNKARLKDRTPTFRGTGHPGTRVRVIKLPKGFKCSPSPAKINAKGRWSCTVKKPLKIRKFRYSIRFIATTAKGTVIARKWIKFWIVRKR